jgi:hypothetical protein
VNVQITNASTLELRPVTFAGLAILAAVAYAPAQLIPLIADDYVVIGLARDFGSWSGLGQLAQDPLYRFRALSSLQAWVTELLFGFSPLALKSGALLLHIVNTWLVALLGLWKPIGWRVSIAGAAFFAIAEGHQEAVIWFSSVPELHVFACTVSAFLCWIVWLQSERPRPLWYTGALLAFVLALLSKESAVCLAGLQAFSLAISHKRRSAVHWMAIVPFAALSVLYFAVIYSTRSAHLHFNDGTFSLSAPFWITVPNSLGRLLWIWGLVALAVLWTHSRKTAIALSCVAAGWAVVSLMPYSFLTYMTRVPSRHTYLASVALALLAGGSLVVVASSGRRFAKAAAAVLAIAMLTHNLGYLWTKKQRQYFERAQPTEALIHLARSTSAPIVVECFPYAQDVARDAIRIGAGLDPTRLKFRPASDCATNYRYALERVDDGMIVARPASHFKRAQ